MKLWIVGKRGILASAMQRKCQENGIDYIATSKREVDVLQEDAVQAQFETLSFTHVINCAAYTAVDQAEDEEEKAHALNAQAVETLAKCASAHGKKLIHFSTDYVFDGKASGYGEEAVTSPLSIYGKSKEAGEKLLQKYYPGSCLIRTSWLFGKEGNHFVKTMIRLMRERKELGVVSDQWGRPTYADDLAGATLSLLDASGTYHFANSGETTWHGFAEAIKKCLEEKSVSLKCHKIHPISTEEFDAKAERPKSSILKTEKLSPPHWEKGLEEVICHALKST